MLNILGGESQRGDAGRPRLSPAATWCSAPRPAGAARCWRRRSATSRSTTTCARGWTPGTAFNCGVVYLPPSGARDGVAELIRVNPGPEEDLHHHREDRRCTMRARSARWARRTASTSSAATASASRTAWNRVRIGGALGGDNPAEALLKGSIAIFSNSGGFTTTIAQYLRDGGLGHDDARSPAARTSTSTTPRREFAFALANDARSKAAVLYCRAGRLLRAGREFTQAGRRLRRRALEEQADARGRPCRRDGRRRRRCRRQGALVHGEVRRRRHLHARTSRCFSAKGAVVTNIAHIPAALTAVMRANGDAARLRARRQPRAQAVVRQRPGARRCRRELDLPVVEAMPPYNEQIAALQRQIGAVFPRQTMKDASGASQMDPKTQVTSLHGVSMLDAAPHPLEANFGLALLHEPAGENDRALLDVAVARRRQPAWRSGAGRGAGRARGRQCAQHGAGRGGSDRRAGRGGARPRGWCDVLIDRFAAAGLRRRARRGRSTWRRSAPTRHARAVPGGTAGCAKPRRCWRGLQARGAKSVFVRYLQSLGRSPDARTRCWRRSARRSPGAR